jgi:recombination protein RecT
MTEIRKDELPGNTGIAPEVEALPAASVLVLRDAPIEVLMIRRHEKSSFMPNAWVFPGGMVDRGDEVIARAAGDDFHDAVIRVAAVRELFEETGVWLGAPLQEAEEKRRRLLGSTLSFQAIVGEAPVDFTQLVWTSHWITPAGLPKRFDTYFFLAKAPANAEATAENTEADETLWITPEEALARNRAGEFEMVFPTIKNLEAIRGFRTPEELIASRRGVDIPAIQPRLVIDGNRKKIVL